jgi:hypothetical protein
LRSAFLIAVLISLATPAAHAADFRYPETGKALIGFSVPDDWSTRVDAAKKIISVSGDKAITLTATLMDYDGEPDALAINTAAAAKAGELYNPQDVTLSGFEGYSFYSRLEASPDTIFRIIIVQIDNFHVALLTMTTSAKLDVERAWDAENIIRTLRLARP